MEEMQAGQMGASDQTVRSEKLERSWPGTHIHGVVSGTMPAVPACHAPTPAGRPAADEAAVAAADTADAEVVFGWASLLAGSTLFCSSPSSAVPVSRVLSGRASPLAGAPAVENWTASDCLPVPPAWVMACLRGGGEKECGCIRLGGSVGACGWEGVGRVRVTTRLLKSASTL